MPLVELSDITKIYHLGGERILDLFRRFHREGRTIILVTHDPEIAAVRRTGSRFATARSRRI